MEQILTVLAVEISAKLELHAKMALVNVLKWSKRSAVATTFAGLTLVATRERWLKPVNMDAVMELACRPVLTTPLDPVRLFMGV